MSTEEAGCSACDETSRRLDSLKAELAATQARLERIRRESFEREHSLAGALWRAISALRIDLERSRAGLTASDEPTVIRD